MNCARGWRTPRTPEEPPCQTSAGIPASGSPPEDTGRISWTVLLLLQRRLRGPHSPRRQQAQKHRPGTARVSSGGESAATEGGGSLPQGGSSGVRGRSPCVCESINRTSNQSEQCVEPPHHLGAPSRPSTTRSRKQRGRNGSARESATAIYGLRLSVQS